MSVGKVLVFALPLLALFYVSTGVTSVNPVNFAGLGAYGFPLDPTSLWGVYDPYVEYGSFWDWCWGYLIGKCDGYFFYF